MLNLISRTIHFGIRPMRSNNLKNTYFLCVFPCLINFTDFLQGLWFVLIPPVSWWGVLKALAVSNKPYLDTLLSGFMALQLGVALKKH